MKSKKVLTFLLYFFEEIRRGQPEEAHNFNIDIWMYIHTRMKHQENLCLETVKISLRNEITQL